MTFDEALPVIFMVLMGISMLVYVISDGYDLGVGMLMHRATPAEKDVMIASIGPFWDANETWLVLGVGILLVAFPKADRADPARRGVRLPRQGQGRAQADVGPVVLCRIDARLGDAGLDARALHQRLRRRLELPTVRSGHRRGAADGLRAARCQLAHHEDGR